MSLDVIRSGQAAPPEIDLVVGLGKNFGIGSGREDIRRSPDGLSVASRIISIAAGVLYRPGRDILFSGGFTAGSDHRSQPDCAREYLLDRFPDIPEEAVLLDEEGDNTGESAKSVPKKVANGNYLHFGLLSVSHHVVNAGILFANNGNSPSALFAAEDIAREYTPREFVLKNEVDIDAWEAMRCVQQEKRKEKLRGYLLETIDPKGMLLGRITRYTRG